MLSFYNFSCKCRINSHLIYLPSLLFICFFVDLQKRILGRFELNVSTSAIKRARKKLGWVKSSVRYCQLVTERNRIKRRLAFARDCQATKDDFSNVIFTDEPSIWLQRHAKVCFRRYDQPAKLKPKEKHPYKVHVWTGISTRGTTDMAIFTGIMRKEFYVDTILSQYLLPYISKVFPDGNYRFIQDNDPKHKSKSATCVVFLLAYSIYFIQKIFVGHYMQSNTLMSTKSNIGQPLQKVQIWIRLKWFGTNLSIISGSMWSQRTRKSL